MIPVTAIFKKQELCFVFSQVWPQEEIEQTLSKNTKFIYSQVLETGGTASQSGPQGKPPGWSRDRRQVRGESGGHGLTGISVCNARQGRVNRLKLASLSNFGKLWAIVVVPSCLVYNSEMIKAKEYCLQGS